jgi:hypothetical protein
MTYYTAINNRAALHATVITWNDIPPGFAPPSSEDTQHGAQDSQDSRSGRAQRTCSLTGASTRMTHFEFRAVDEYRWPMSQSAEDACHEAAHIVGRGDTLTRVSGSANAQPGGALRPGRTRVVGHISSSESPPTARVSSFGSRTRRVSCCTTSLRRGCFFIPAE